MAVEDMASPNPTTIAACHERLNQAAMLVSTIPVTTKLRTTQSEYGMAQRPQAGGLEFQPDEEEQQHDAYFREVQRCVRVGNQSQAPWADDRARREIAEHRAELHPPEQRHDD